MSIEKEDIEIIFIYKTIDEISFLPSFIIFFKKDRILNKLDYRISAIKLKELEYDSIYDYIHNHKSMLINRGVNVKTNDLNLIKSVDESIIKEKNKLKYILRKQKIDKLLKDDKT